MKIDPLTVVLEIELIEGSFSAPADSVLFTVNGRKVDRDSFHTIAMFHFNTVSDKRIEDRYNGNAWPKKEKKK